MVRILAQDEKFQTSFFRSRYQTKALKKANPLSNFKSKLIASVAKRSLIELAVSALSVGIACAFIATPVGIITLVASSIAIVAFSAILRSVASFAIYKQTKLNFDLSIEGKQKKEAFSYLQKVAEFIAPWGYSDVVDKNTRDVLTHEAGHALAARILVKKPDATISIVPFKGGSTSYRIGILSKIGEFFGRNRTKAIISAAGPFLAVATSTVAFGISYAIEKKTPELARYMRYAAVDSIGNQAIYALSALWANAATNSGHDFLQLWASGIHPLIAVVSALVVPIFIKIGFLIRNAVKLKRIKKIAAMEAKRDSISYKIKLSSQLTAADRALLKTEISYKTYSIHSAILQKPLAKN